MKYRGHEQYYYLKNFLIINKFIIIELDIYNILYPIIKIFIKI